MCAMKEFLKEVVNLFKDAGMDAWLHFCVTAILVVLLKVVMPLHYSAFVTLVISILGKEIIWDAILKKGVPSLKDVCFDIWGTMFGCILLLLLGAC